jgi:undecaprenyl-diphosphatase
VALIVFALCAWLAVAPGAETAQTDLVTWFNEPPQPLAAVCAVVNPLLRPVPLILLGTVFVGWVLLSARNRAERLEIARSTVIAIAAAELFAQIGKHLANQPRPLAVLPGLDDHGYPIQPHGNAFPSAHTAIVVALVGALWPWMHWPQRVVAVLIAVLVMINRLYIGAHWPLDVVGGAALGTLAASISWLIAARWPVRPKSAAPSVAPSRAPDS